MKENPLEMIMILVIKENGEVKLLKEAVKDIA